MESAAEELRRLGQIIENLLLLARADSGRPLKLRENVRVDEVMLEVVERLQAFARTSQVKLNMTMDPASPDGSAEASEEGLTVLGDADLLSSLFSNLVQNAIKYSAAGQTVEIRVGSESTGPRVTVRDFGAGMAAEELPRLFERFHRAENPSRSPTKGTGLGLAIAKWIADAHGATITVESKPGEGSTFTVCFRKPIPNS
jgi:signal transduction histidine kinase